ncbi:MAG TPA: trypsin-like peptidase domain-containing protein, partial [Pseudonocardia sp.]|nr:trypsin-like peptidase domain-containing protein [Pseudonocardia sp.]
SGGQPSSTQQPARARSPPWKRLLRALTGRGGQAVAVLGAVALTVTALLAAHHGADPSSMMAVAGLGWLRPGRRAALRQLRTGVDEANRSLGEYVDAERGAATALNLARRGSAARENWATALAEPLRAAGWSDADVEQALAQALSLPVELVRAQLADPAITHPVHLPGELRAALADPHSTPAKLLAATETAVTRLDQWLGAAHSTWVHTTGQTAAERGRHAERIAELGTAARDANLPARAIARAIRTSAAPAPAFTPATTPTSTPTPVGPSRRGWSRPMRPSTSRTRWGLAAVAGIGVGTGLVLAGAGIVVTVAAYGVLGASAVLAARVGWSTVRVRGPTATWGGRAELAAKALAIGAVAVAVGLHAPADLALALDWLIKHPKWSSTAKSVWAALLITTPLAARYVWHRRSANRAKGAHVWPRVDALRSVGFAFVVSAVNNLLQLSTIPVLVSWIAGTWLAQQVGLTDAWAAAIPAAIAAFVGSAVQRRTTGGQRTWFAAISAIYAVVVSHWISPALSISSAPHNWGVYFGTALWVWLAVQGTSSFIGDYIVAGFGRAGQRVFRNSQRQGRVAAVRVSLRAHGSDSRWRMVQLWTTKVRLGWQNKKRQDWDPRGRPDWRVSALKLDALISSMLTYLIVRPWPGFDDTIWMVGARSGAALIVLTSSWWGRDLWERSLKVLGYLSPRALARRHRPLVALRRVHRSIEPWGLPPSYRDLLADFLALTAVDAPGQGWARNDALRTQLTALARGGLDEQLTDPAQRARLAEEVARRMVVAITQQPSPAADLVALTRKPSLRDEAQDVLARWYDRHEQHVRAVSLGLLMIANNRALTGAAGRMTGRDGEVAKFMDLMLKELLKPTNLGELKLTAEDVEALGVPNRVGTVLRFQWEQRLAQALKERHDLRVEYLEQHLLPLLYRWRDTMSPDEHTSRTAARIERLEAEVAIRRYEGQLSSELGRSIDGRGLVATGALLRQRRYSLETAIAADRARLNDPAVTGGRDAIIGRLTTYYRVDAALALVARSVAIVDELELHRVERDWWDTALTNAVTTPAAERLSTSSLLYPLLTIAGNSGPMTVEQLVAGIGGEQRAREHQLAQWVELGALVRTETGAYQPSDQFRDAWRNANPRLRHAIWTNPLGRQGTHADEDFRLPGWRHVEPLTQVDLPDGPYGQPSAKFGIRHGAEASARSRAYDALLELLITGQRALYDYRDPSFWNDVVAQPRQKWRDRRYQHDNPSSRVEPLPKASTQAGGDASTPVRRPARELRDQLALVAQLTSEEWTAEWRVLSLREQHRRARANGTHAGHHAAPGRPDQRATDPADLRAAQFALAEATRNRLEAYEDLRALVTRITTEDYPDIGDRPTLITWRLETAARRLLEGPSRDAPTPIAPLELKRAYEGLKAARKVLRGAQEGAEAYDDAVFQAWIALRRFTSAALAAREAKLLVQFVPRRMVRKGENRSRALIRLAPNRLADARGFIPAPLATESDGIQVSITHTNNPDPTHNNITFELPVRGRTQVVGHSRAGRAGRNEDAVAVHVDPDTGVITIVLADGLSSGLYSWWASGLTVDTVVAELTRPDYLRLLTSNTATAHDLTDAERAALGIRAGLSAEELKAIHLTGPQRDEIARLAHRAAAEVAGARVAALAIPGQVYQPATAYLALQILPRRAGHSSRGRTIRSHLGDARLYHLGVDGVATQLTEDHSNPDTGGMTGFLGENPRTAPRIDIEDITTQGALLLATKGLYFLGEHEPADLAAAAALSRTDSPGAVVDRLVAAAVAAGGTGNLTAVVVHVPSDGIPAPKSPTSRSLRREAARGARTTRGPTKRRQVAVAGRHRTRRQRGGTGGTDGTVAIGGLSDPQRRLLARVLPLLAPHLRPLEQLTDLMPHGPPDARGVRVLDLGLDQVREVLAGTTLSGAELSEVTDILTRLVVFGWHDDSRAAARLMPRSTDRLTVITRAMLVELLAHRDAQLLTDAELAVLLSSEVPAALADLVLAARTVAAAPGTWNRIRRLIRPASTPTAPGDPDGARGPRSSGPGTGGPSRGSGGDFDAAQRAGIEPLLDPARGAEVVLPGELAAFGGLALHEVAHTWGVAAIDGLNDQTGTATGVDDLVIYAHNGWLFLDTRTLAALRAGALAPDALAALLRHELAHLQHPDWSEAQIAEAYPLPALGPVLDAAARLGTTAVGRRGGAPRLVVASQRPAMPSTRDEWLPGLGVTPGSPVGSAGPFQEVLLDGVGYPEFTGANIGALAEAMAALRVGGVLFVRTGSRAQEQLSEITETLRRLGAGPVQVRTGPYRIVAVKTAPTDPVAYQGVHRLGASRGSDDAGPDEATEAPTRTRVVRPAPRAGPTAPQGGLQERIRGWFGRASRDWALPRQLSDELGADQASLLAAAEASPFLLVVPTELGGSQLIALSEAAVRAGFRGGTLDKRPMLVLAGRAGRLIVDGRQIESTHGGWAKTGLAHFVDRLESQMATWLLNSGGVGPGRSDQSWAQLAMAWRAAGDPVTTSGPFALRRVDLGIPVGRLPDGSVASAVDILTLRLGSGRDVLLEVAPVAEGADYGPLFTAGYPERSVVRIGTVRGATIGTGVVVRAAAPGRPARVLTALHVVTAYQNRYKAGGSLVANGHRVTNWTTLSPGEYGQNRALAAEVRATFGHHVSEIDTVDLALLEVEGLDEPAVAVRRTPMRPGERLAVSGFPQAHPLTAQGYLTRQKAGHLGVTVLLGKGVSGGPALDAEHLLTGIVSFRPTDDSRLHLTGPELIADFLELAGAKLDRRTPGGGALAVGLWSAADTELLLRVLPELAPYLKSASALGYRMPRGPPGTPTTWVLDEATVRPVLDELVARGVLSQAERDRVVAALSRLVAFAWRDPSVPLAAGGAIVTTGRVLDELTEHQATGRMTTAQVRAWWRDVLAHELRHLTDPTYHGAAHEHDTAVTVAPLLAARAARAAAVTAAAPLEAAALLDRAERDIVAHLLTDPRRPGGVDPVVADAGLALVEARLRLISGHLGRGRELLTGGDLSGATGWVGAAHAQLNRARVMLTVLGNAMVSPELIDQLADRAHAALSKVNELREAIHEADPDWTPADSVQEALAKLGSLTARPLEELATIVGVAADELEELAGPSLVITGAAGNRVGWWMDARISGLGFITREGEQGAETLLLDTEFGTLALTGGRIEVDRMLSGAATMLRELAEQAAWWLPGGLDDRERELGVLRLIAEAARLRPVHTGVDGQLEIRRVDFGRPIAAMLWDRGEPTGTAELVTWRLASGERLLVGFHPVRADAPLGPVGVAAAAGARAGVVDFHTVDGRVLGTGVVVRPGGGDGPAHVLTALHVAVEHTVTAPLMVAGQPIAGWVPVPVQGYGADRELARAATEWRGQAATSKRLDAPDLALVAVFGLTQPVVAIAPPGTSIGQSVLINGNPRGERTATQAPVTELHPGHLRLLVSLAGGVSGSPGFSTDGKVVTIVSAGGHSHLVGVSAELIGPFLRYATPLLTELIGSLYSVDLLAEVAEPLSEFGTTLVRAAGDVDEHLTVVERLVRRLFVELAHNPWRVLAELGEDPGYLIDPVTAGLAWVPTLGTFAGLTERADAVQHELRRLLEQAVAAYGGLTPEQVALVSDLGTSVVVYQNLLDSLPGDPASRWEQLSAELGDDPAQFLAYERQVLASAPAVPPFTELGALIEDLQARFEQTHAAAHADPQPERDGPERGGPERGDGRRRGVMPLLALGPGTNWLGELARHPLLAGFAAAAGVVAVVALGARAVRWWLARRRALPEERRRDGWLPVRRGPRATLRAATAEARRALGEFLTAERGLRTAIALARGRLADRVDWAPALAEGLHDTGRTAAEIETALATALRIPAATVRASLHAAGATAAELAAGLPAEVRAAPDDEPGDAGALLAATTAEVDRLESWLHTARQTLAATAPRTAEQRRRTTEALEEATAAALAAGMRARAISRITSRADARATARANAEPLRGRRVLAALARQWTRLARRGSAIASWLSTRLPAWLRPTRRLPVPVPVTDGWTMTRPAPPGVGGAAWLNLWRVVSWVALDPLAAARQHSTSGLSAAELATLAEQGAPPDAPVWVHDLLSSVHETGESHTELTERLTLELAVLQRHGLVDSRRDDDGTHNYRPGGLLGQLLARVPPGAVTALLANPEHVTGAALDTLAPAGQARAILGWLRETVLAHGEVERGVWAALPLWLRGPSGWAAARGLRTLAAPIRAMAKAARAAATAEEQARRAGLADDVVTALASARHEADTALANAM